MFRYYLYPPAFSKACIQEIENNLKELNNVLTVHCDQYDIFHYDLSLFEVETNEKDKLADVLWGKLPDIQFSRIVLPQILIKLKVLQRNYADLEDFNGEFNNTLNALWGVNFCLDHLCHIFNVNKYNEFRSESLKKILCKENFKKFQPLICSHLSFTDDVFNSIAIGSDKVFNQILDRMIEFDKYVKIWCKLKIPFNVKDLNLKTSLTASDESDSVKNDEKKKRERYFILPNIGGQYCYLHIKTGDFRFHFYPDNNTRKVYVAYIGPHLTL